MIENLPLYISLLFGCTTIATLLLLFWTIKNATSEKTRKSAKFIAIISVVWLVIQAVLSWNNVYNTNTDAFPPKIILLGILPVICSIIVVFSTSKGRQFIDNLPLKNLTYLHVVRIPVELVLYWLFLNKTIPQIMTFEGTNFDILAGISAPFLAYFTFEKKKLNLNLVLIWNILSLGLLLNIVVTAMLSAPSPIQKIAFDQPNIAILNFPFCWLPTFIVPIVLFSHLVAIRKLIYFKNNTSLLLP
jgi:hypothetical protein